MKILLATTNTHKLEEFKFLADKFNIEFITLKDLECEIESPEDHKTFEENALQKAQFYFDKFNIPTIADDSGLEVHNLNNFPGIKSKRWMSNCKYSTKVEKLLKMLDGKDSTCNYKAAIAYVDNTQKQVFTGVLEGKLVNPDKENKTAFGYDLGFWLEDKNTLVSDISTEEKNKISHRFKALEKFTNWFEQTKK